MAFGSNHLCNHETGLLPLDNFHSQCLNYVCTVYALKWEIHIIIRSLCSLNFLSVKIKSSITQLQYNLCTNAERMLFYNCLYTINKALLL